MSTSPVHQKGFWDYAAPPAAAAAAIATPPIFHFFERKGALQRGQPIPRFGVESVKGGFKSTVPISVIVGMQMAIEPVVEEKLREYLPPFAAKMGSAGVAGAASTIPYAMFNRLSSKLPMFPLGLNRWQVVAITGRETCFVGSTGFSKHIRPYLGDSETAKHASHFISGSAGAIAGHACDTAFTCLQENKPVVLKQLFRGLVPRTVGSGLFMMSYKYYCEKIQSK